jgi:hypothetical protein
LTVMKCQSLFFTAALGVDRRGLGVDRQHHGVASRRTTRGSSPPCSLRLSGPVVPCRAIATTSSCDWA